MSVSCLGCYTAIFQELTGGNWVKGTWFLCYFSQVYVDLQSPQYNFLIFKKAPNISSFLKTFVKDFYFKQFLNGFL